MLDLARRAAEVLVERSANLARENAWEGEFREALSEWLTEDPPEQGQPPNEVLERAVSGVLPLTLRHDHPRCFGFVASSPTWPGVVADFLAAGYNINSCNWLVATGTSQLECVVIDWFRRWLGYPETAGGLPTSGGSAASLDAIVAAREAAGYPAHAAVYMSQRRSHRHRGRRSAGCAGRLLRGGVSLAARRRCVRRVRHLDRTWQEAALRHRARRFSGARRTQVVLPAL